MITTQDYLRLLEPWAKASATHDYICPDRPDLVCYGTGFNEWGVQTNQKALAALATLACHPQLNEKHAGMTREELLARAMGMLRFSLESHKAGSYHCTDGAKWGHTWISALGLERVMHGVEALEPHLNDSDRQLLRDVLVSESDWLLNHYEVVGGPIQNNKPESNIWNGAILHRTAMMYPDTPRAEQYREKGTAFLTNGISVASDAQNDTIIDGRPISEWFIGDNFFESYALNHHGYLNVGYMVICLSNIAMLYFSCRSRNIEPPAALLHHAADLWPLVKACTFPDGRLLRIGGDTRVRYCYCQDYAIPTWMFMAEHLGDRDCIAFEEQWLEQVKREVDHNGDSTFLSDRCSQLEAASPLYYTRLESDRAVALSYGAWWRHVHEDIPATAPESPQPITFAWHDDYHGALMHRGEKRIASFTWRAAEPPQGLCLPIDASNLAEWRQNLTGEIKGGGALQTWDQGSHNERQFDGGFFTCGRIGINSQHMVAEGQPNDAPAANLDIAFAALPDDTTCVVMQRAKTPDSRMYLQSIKAVGVKVPNDLFNANNRVYHTETGSAEVSGVGSNAENIDTASRWINVDGRLGLSLAYGADSIMIVRPGRRQIGLKRYPWQDNSRAGGMLYADEICACNVQGIRAYDANATLFDVGFAVQAAADQAATRSIANSCRGVDLAGFADARAMITVAADGRLWLFIANFGEAPAKVILPSVGVRAASDAITGGMVDLAEEIAIDPHDARLLRLET